MRQRDEHILIWMRDGDLARRLLTDFERHQLRATWSASLPEVISFVERVYPAAIASTLNDVASPSLMDIETLLTFLKMGNEALALPPIPIWSVAVPTAALLSRIGELDLPIQVVPPEQGASGVRRDIMGYLERSRPPGQPLAVTQSVLYVGTDPQVGQILMRYLRAVGISCRAVRGALEALEALESELFKAVVADFDGEPAGRALLRALTEHHSELPVLAIAQPGDWLSTIPPHRLPPNLTGVLPKPVRLQTLEMCLSRLLRIPMHVQGADAPGATT